jgi:hypothetical protein
MHRDRTLQLARAGLAALFLVLLTALFSGVAIAAQKTRPAVSPLQDVVAVGRMPGRILLATPALPMSARTWRRRSIRVAPGDQEIEQAVLSRGGTKLLVVFDDGSRLVFDLTRKVSAIARSQPGSAQHRLAHELFPVQEQGRICLVDDSGAGQPRDCREARQAVMDAEGNVLYAHTDGTLALLPQGRAALDPALPFHLPPGARYEIFPHARVAVAQPDGKIRVLDAASSDGAVLGAYDSWEAAALRAVAGGAATDDEIIAFAKSLVAPAAKAASRADSNGTAEAKPLRNDGLQSRPGARSIQWSFFHVTPESALYAPVLELAPKEPDYPTDVGIWDLITPLAQGATTREQFHAAYDSLGAERLRRCSVYYRASSYPGSWLLEYWYYYPFDEGRPHPHFHDAEHVFVEVDKLGGPVRSVLANAHDSLAPNNLYSTFLLGAKPVDLPLYAFSELGKHAMSPDIDGDGRFRRGIDVNNASDQYEVWGVRDRSAKLGKMMMAYFSYMTIPRQEQDRFALAADRDFFPGLAVPEERTTCELRPLPEEPTTEAQRRKGTRDVSNPEGAEAATSIASPEAAREYLVAHDEQRPTEIYKPWVIPWRELRIGYALFDHMSGQQEFSAQYVLNLRQVTRHYFPFAGRLSLETSFSPWSESFPSSDGNTITASNAVGLGARFERFLTNTQGFYGGFTEYLVRDSAQAAAGGAMSAPYWALDGPWYRVGYVIELPSLKKGNLTHQVGVMVRGSHLRVEWRISLGVFRRKGRNYFGIRPDDPNPYE